MMRSQLATYLISVISPVVLETSAIGTLVERTTGYTMLLHLPDGYKPAQVAPALAAKIQTLPAALRGSLT